ncbi:MAG: indolepyruvate oxidoreductase subunit beta [Candidatus Thorarchaeota archaeon]
MSGIGRNTSVLNIVISGVGGQGVLTLAEVLSRAALRSSHNVRVGEIHGMAQRGGHVVCTVRIGSGAYGPIVDPGSGHLLVGFEPVETLREVHLIRHDGLIVMNTHIQYPVAVSMGEAEYPDMSVVNESLHRFAGRVIELDAMDLAETAGSPRSMNMVMMGAVIATGFVPVSREIALEVVASSFPGRFREINTRAFEAGFSAISAAMRG